MRASCDVRSGVAQGEPSEAETVMPEFADGMANSPAVVGGTPAVAPFTGLTMRSGKAKLRAAEWNGVGSRAVGGVMVMAEPVIPGSAAALPMAMAVGVGSGRSSAGTKPRRCSPSADCGTPLLPGSTPWAYKCINLALS